MAETIEDANRTAILTKGTSKAHDALREDLIQHGLIAKHKGNVYIFVASINQWGVLVSPEVQRQICTLTGSDSATVNYLSASIPYKKFIESNASITGSIPVSICIGTRRLAISMDEGGLILTQCNNIASITRSLDDRISSFCVMPSMFSRIPLSWKSGGPQRLLKFISILFNDETELRTLMWIIGSAAVDPASRSKCLFLYGPAGTGKTTVINMILDLFTGCCGTIAASLLTDKNRYMTISEACTVASNRIVTAGDINLSNEHSLNYHVVKEITGHDTIGIPPFSVRTRCTLVFASNDIPDPTVQTSWFSEAIARRLIVLPMNVRIPPGLISERPESDEDLIDMLLACVYTYLENTESPPLSFRSLMSSIMGSQYYTYADRLHYDDTISDVDAIHANCMLEQALGLDSNTLGELARLRSREYVCEVGNVCYIKGLCIVE